MTTTVYATKAWRMARMVVLQRDGYVCQIKGPRCTHRATEADHIVELDAGGEALALANLRAACKPCNASRGAAYGNAKREPRSQRWY